MFKLCKKYATPSPNFLNPIEPYIQLKKDNEDYNEIGGVPAAVSDTIKKALMKNIFGDEETKDKIISIRIYEKKFDENNPAWWMEQRDAMIFRTKDDYKDMYDRKELESNGKVVDY